jgi:hypothetical protein
MSGLILVKELPENLDEKVQAGEEAGQLLDEIDLTHQVIKGASAVQLLHSLGQASLSDELEETLERIGGWIDELIDTASAKAADSMLAGRLVSIANLLAAGHRELTAQVRAGGVETSTDSLRYIRRAYNDLQDVLSLTHLGSAPVANGCAIEINHLIEIRSH